MSIEAELQKIPAMGTRFVQAIVGDETILAVQTGKQIHGDILASILSDQGIEFQTTMNKDDISIPEVSGPGYRAAGMGQVMGSRGQYIFFSKSRDYKIGPDPEHLQQCQELVGDDITLTIKDYRY